MATFKERAENTQVSIRIESRKASELEAVIFITDSEATREFKLNISQDTTNSDPLARDITELYGKIAQFCLIQVMRSTLDTLEGAEGRNETPGG